MSFTNPRIYVVTGKDDNNWQSDDECLFRRGPKWRWQLLLFKVKKRRRINSPVKSTPVSRYPPPRFHPDVYPNPRDRFIAYGLTGNELLIFFFFFFSFISFFFLFFFYTGVERKAEVRSFLRRLFTFERFTEHVEYPTVLALGTELIHPPDVGGHKAAYRRFSSDDRQYVYYRLFLL